jgi:hypothetical protein
MRSNHEPGVCTWHKSEVLGRINDVRLRAIRTKYARCRLVRS